MRTVPENLSRPNRAQKLDLIAWAILYLQHHTGGLAPTNYASLDYLAADEVPSFIAGRIPAPDAEVRRMRLPFEIGHLTPKDVAKGTVCFIGSISIGHDYHLPGGMVERWRTAYFIDSQRCSVGRRVEGELLGADYSLRPLSNDSDVRASFPNRFTISEAWQLSELLDAKTPVLPYSPRGAGFTAVE